MSDDEIKNTDEEVKEDEQLIETEVENLTEVVEPESVVTEIKPKPKRKRVHVYLAKYVGTAKQITLSGVGRIHPGVEFEVSENIANTLGLDENFEVRTTYKYIEVLGSN